MLHKTLNVISLIKDFISKAFQPEKKTISAEFAEPIRATFVQWLLTWNVARQLLSYGAIPSAQVGQAIFNLWTAVSHVYKWLRTASKKSFDEDATKTVAKNKTDSDTDSGFGSEDDDRYGPPPGSN